jgi:hypothetical protein
MKFNFLSLVFVLLVSSLSSADVTCGVIQLYLTDNPNDVAALTLFQRGSLDLTKKWDFMATGAGSNSLKLEQITSTQSILVDEGHFVQYGKNSIIRKFAVKFDLSSSQRVSVAWDEVRRSYMPTKTITQHVICIESMPE